MLLGWLSLLAPALGHGVVLHQGEHGHLALKGNLQFDLGEVWDVGAARSGHGMWRRQRVAIDAGVGQRLTLMAEFDGKASEWTDLYLSFRGLGPGTLYAGQFKQFIGLDQLTSSKRLLLAERSSSDAAFAVARRLGVGYQIVRPGHGLGISLFGRALDNAPSSSGIAVRGWLSPRNSSGDVTHYGLALTRESPDQDAVRFSARPGTRFTTLRAARSPLLLDSEALTRIGLEYGRVQGPWYLQGEALWVRVERAGADFDGHSAYLQASYSSGQPRGYKDGVFQAPGGEHPWELGLRIDHIDLDDGSVRGGSALGLGVVAAYWLGKDSRVLLDAHRYLRSRSEQDPVSLTLRLQWAF